MNQRTGMDKRQPTQYAQDNLDGIFHIERSILFDSFIKQHAAVELSDQIMIYRIAFFHLAIVDITNDIDVFIGIQFLAELDLVDLLAFEELLTRDALEFVNLHEIHHVVRSKHRIRLCYHTFLYKRVDDILANLLTFFECFHR